MNLLERMIIEGRLNNVEKKYPLLALKHQGESIIDKFEAHDPSGNNKYLMWMATIFMQLFVNDLENDSLGHTAKELGKFQEYVEEQYKKHLRGFVTGVTDWKTVNPDTIINKVEQFHYLLPYLKNKDIYSKEYQTSYEESPNPFRKISDALEQAGAEKKVAAEKKAMKQAKKVGAKSGSEVVYENKAGAIALRIYSTEAACFFGQGTRWCIAAKQENQFENYSDDGYAFYYILNSRHLDRDFQKFAVLFQTLPDQQSSSVWNTASLPVAEIFDASDNVVGASTLYKALLNTGALGKLDSTDSELSFAEQGHAEFDKMLDTMAAHAKANPITQSLGIYADEAWDERDSLGGFSHDFRDVYENDPSGGENIATGLPTTKKVRDKISLKVYKPVLIDIPIGVFSNLLKALVTPTGDMKLGKGSDGLRQTNQKFYVKLRDEYANEARKIAEQHLDDYLQSIGKDYELKEDNGKLFSFDDEETLVRRARIKDVRFYTHGEKRVANGVYRPSPGNDRVTRLKNSSNSMTTAFDQSMYNLVQQWEGNPHAVGSNEGNKHTAPELHKFARQRYNLALHFLVEFYPENAEVATAKHTPPARQARNVVPHEMEPQYYIFNNKEEVDKYFSEIAELEDHFYEQNYMKSLKQKLKQSGLVQHSPWLDKGSTKQQGLEFSKKKDSTPQKSERAKHAQAAIDAYGRRPSAARDTPQQVQVDEQNLISRWKKIIKT